MSTHQFVAVLLLLAAAFLAGLIVGLPDAPDIPAPPAEPDTVYVTRPPIILRDTVRVPITVYRDPPRPPTFCQVAGLDLADIDRDAPWSESYVRQLLACYSR